MSANVIFAFELPSWWGFAVFGAVFVGIFVLATYLSRKRTQALTTLALQQGLTFEGDKWLTPESAPQLESPLFQGKSGPGFKNIISGKRGGLSCSFVDYSYRSGKNSISQTLATFTQDVWLPQFAVGPSDMLHKFSDALLHKAIQFESDPDFSKRFRLVSPDPDKAREMFAPGLLTFIENLDPAAKWHIEGSGRTLIIYRQGKQVSAEAYPAFIDATTDMAKTFLSLSGLKKPSA
ncbi:MAG: hypothetical protein ABSA32_14785 [Candidatus Acidiferrales bacterium]